MEANKQIILDVTELTPEAKDTLILESAKLNKSPQETLGKLLNLLVREKHQPTKTTQQPA